MKQAWAQEGTAVVATAPQSAVLPVHSGPEVVGGAEVVPLPPGGAEDDSTEELEPPVVVGGWLVVGGALVVEPPVQGVVGCAVTQSQRELT